MDRSKIEELIKSRKDELQSVLSAHDAFVKDAQEKYDKFLKDVHSESGAVSQKANQLQGMISQLETLLPEFAES